MVAFRLKTGGDELALISLPWDVPLAEWPDEMSRALPAGVHRHVVRFVDAQGTTLALKELPQRYADREFVMLERLRDENLPGVRLVGVASDRSSRDGEPLEAVLITRHLRYSLPYRHLFSEARHEGMRDKVVDALAVLLVRLHTVGFFWGDCSLNNALFRRDAGALRAYVVDTETAEWHQELTVGQRRLDLEIAADNTYGGLLDLDAEQQLDDDVDPESVVDRLVARYGALWADLHDVEELPRGELGRIHARLARLNELGFDTEEYELQEAGGVVRFRPTIVEEGHHVRTLTRLTGIVAHENQARRLLNALRGYGAWLSQQDGEMLPEAVAAYRWLTERWEPTLALVPAELRGRLEDAELYHEILEHSWYLGEREGEDVLLEEAAADYVATVLSRTPDHRTVLP